MRRRKPQTNGRRVRTVSRPSPYGNGWETVVLAIDVDPVEHMAARGWISTAQKQAADRFRKAYEAVTGSLGLGIDYSQERVDVSGSGQAVSQAALDGMTVLRRAMLVLGKIDYGVVTAIAGQGITIESYALRLMGGQEVARKEVRRRFRSALDALAVEWGYERSPGGLRRVRAWSEGLGDPFEGVIVPAAAFIHPGSRPKRA